MKSHAVALDRADPAFAGQAAYTRGMLRVYDPLVVRVSSRFVWRCTSRRILEHYDRHVAASHLDVGPGTGDYLDRCSFPLERPRVTLLDANPEVLRFAGNRIRRYRPVTHLADVLKPIDLPRASFGSIGLSYVLHCLPGRMEAKASVLDNLIPLVDPGGVIFGTTVLGTGVRHTVLGHRLMHLYNRKGIFSNVQDDLDSLECALSERFDRSEVGVQGTVALFAGWTRGPEVAS